MAIRFASTISLLVFAACLLIGTLQASNPFETVILRALLAMFVTMLVGLVVGWMAQKMLDENLSDREKKSEKLEVKTGQSDR
jgi:NhaP-type Na+/H+ or K+/H+ antiporter